MAEDTTPAPVPVAPAAQRPAPATVPLTPEQQAISTANAAQKELEQRRANPTVRRDNRPANPIVTNPPEPEAPAVEPHPDDMSISPSTRAEMEAGRKALEASKPRADQLAAGARANSSLSPVDKTEQDQKQNPKV